MTNNIHIRTTDSGVAVYNYGGGSVEMTGAHFSELNMGGSFGNGSNATYGQVNFIDPENGNFGIVE